MLVMPASRSQSATRAVCATLWRRPTACCTRSSKSCTPRLARVTPASAKAKAYSRVSVRGSISTASSAFGVNVKFFCSDAITREKSCAVSMVGVPPPQCTCVRTARTDDVTNERDFALQQVHIRRNRGIAARNRRVAPAVEAKLGAERDMEVNRD